MYTILIVEDDIFLQAEIKKMLLCHNKKLHLITSSKGRESLKLALKSTIDLFIIDIMLPDWNGLELAKELRKTYQKAPIILESASEDYKSLAMVHDNFENIVYIAKPFTSEKLMKKVNSALTTIEKEEQYLVLKQRKIYRSIPIKNIIFIESVNNKHTIRIVSYDDMERKLCDEEFYGVPLKKILLKVENSKRLCRCHKSFIVNLYKIKKIDTSGKLIYVKYKEQNIPIGDAYKKNFEEEFKNGLDY